MNAPYPPQQGQPIASPAMPAAMPSPDTPAPATAPATAPVTHDVTVVTTKKLAQAKVMGVPPEEFGIERGARNIRDCNYCFHEVVTKTESQLIGEGFDEDQVRMLGTYIGNNDAETITRDSVQEHYFQQDGAPNTAARLVRITEHYVRMDYEGKRRACLYMVVTGGDQGQILKRDGKEVIEPIDVIPFAATTPVPITHRFFGRSVADLVMPAQLEKTALKRGGLDNLYLHNNPRAEIAQSGITEDTLDDYLTSRSGAPIRVKTPGTVVWQVVPDITASVYPMMQYIDAELETRTGLTKQGQGLDANALQNQSATAVAQVFSASQMRMKLIARIMAEGVRDIFSLLHHTIRTHGQEQQTVRLRNKWIPVDPRNWKTRNDMTINVGLGSGGKAQQYAQLMGLAGLQEKLLAGGKAHLVGDQNLFNMATDIAKVSGHKNADRYFQDPSDKNPDGSPKYPPVSPPPDPKLQVEQVRQQGKQQEVAQKGQLDQQKAQADTLHQQIKAQADIEVAKVKAELDAKLAIINGHIQAIQAEQKMRHDAQAHHVNMASTVLDMAATAHAHDAKMEQGEQTHEARLEQMKSKPKGAGDAG